MRSKRAEFPDAVKAEIYARDRAMCCYSGKSLWLLDYGAGPALADHVDHIVPASKGGSNDPSNGLLSTFIHNRIRRDGVAPLRLFDEGLPNLDAFWIFGTIPAHIVDHLLRFACLHPSDWYLNRAVVNLRTATGHLSEPRRKDGRKHTRDTGYYCRSALARLEQWRASIVADDVPSLAERHLLPLAPRTDHEILLQILNAKSESEIRAIAEQLAPYLLASFDAVDQMFDLDTERSLRKHMRSINENPQVVDSVKLAIGSYLSRVLPNNRA